MRTAFLVGIIALLILALPGVVAFAADLFGYGADLNNWAEEHLGLSHRLALATPAAVVLFFVPPAIVLLYFLRLKRRPMTVASTYLWKKSVEDLHVNRLMQWMRRNVLLLLQLLCILLVIYAVLGLRTQGALTGGRHYIILIDNSVSMSATDLQPEHRTRLDWAKAEAYKLIDAANDGDPGMVIVFNSTAEIRRSYTTNKEELRAAVREVEATEFTTRIDEALALAASRANPYRSTENAAVAPANPEPGKERTYFAPDGFEADVYLLSDGRFPPVQDFSLQNLSVQYPRMPDKLGGGRSDNVAVVGFDVARDPDRAGRYGASARLANYRPDASEVKVWLDLKKGDGTLVKVYPPNAPPGTANPERVRIPGKPEAKADEAAPGKSADALPPNVRNLTFTLEGVAENADLQLEVRLEHPGDALAADDSAVLVFGVARKANVLVVTPGNRILRFYYDTKEAKGLANFTYAEPADWPQYIGRARDGKYDLVVFDRTGPKAEEDMPAANTLFVGYPPPPYPPLGRAAPGDPNAVTEVKNPKVRVPDRRHPLMRDLSSIEEIGIDASFRFPKLPPRTPKLIEGDGNLELVVAIARQAFTDVVLTFPIVTDNADGPDRVYHTSWPLQPTFPLFLRNVLIQLGNVRFAGVDDPLRPGDVMPLRPGAEQEVRVFKPGALTSQAFDRGNRPEVTFGGTDARGVYTAEWGSGDARQTRRFAVNLLDADESDLAPLTQVQIGSTTVAAGESRRVPFELWQFVVVLALAVVLVEWWIYNRRVQI